MNHQIAFLAYTLLTHENESWLRKKDENKWWEGGFSAKICLRFKEILEDSFDTKTRISVLSMNDKNKPLFLCC
jgi:hypothetical protein